MRNAKLNADANEVSFAFNYEHHLSLIGKVVCKLKALFVSEKGFELRPFNFWL